MKRYAFLCYTSVLIFFFPSGTTGAQFQATCKLPTTVCHSQKMLMRQSWAAFSLHLAWHGLWWLWR